VVDDRSVPQAEVNGDRGLILANAERLLRLLMTLPGRRDDALAVVNGFFGDRLADQGSPLAIPMTLRSRTDPLTLDRDSLAEAFPQATSRICLFVHGLMSNESIWEFPGDPHTTYGSLLARDHGVTPIYLRYNTGRHISVNGRELAGLLHRLVSAWPVPVHDISLIGHSMGGLVIRSSCHYASATRPWWSVISLRRSWISKTRQSCSSVSQTPAPPSKCSSTSPAPRCGPCRSLQRAWSAWASTHAAQESGISGSARLPTRSGWNGIPVHFIDRCRTVSRHGRERPTSSSPVVSQLTRLTR